MWKELKEKIEEKNIFKNYKFIKQENMFLNNKIDSQRIIIVNDKKTIEELKNKNNELKRTIKKLEMNLAENEKKRRRLASSIGGYTTNYQRLKEQTKKQKQEIKALKLENKDINTQMISISLEKDKLCNLVDKLQKQNTWLKKRVPKPTLKELEDYTFKRGEMR